MTQTSIRKIIADDVHSHIDSVETFLDFLEGPTWIFFPGKSSHSCRLITTLLHGNEPSGCYAILRLIKENFIPVADTWILVASVSTALEKPVFSNRVKAGNQDLNRCFSGPWKTEIEVLAKKIIDDISELQPESIVDIHNTSGSGPGFCVSTYFSTDIDKLAGIFSNSLVITDIKLGALMEKDFNCPILTVECGGNQSDLSHLFAYNGLQKYLSLSDISTIEKTADLQYYHHPLRLELKEGYQLTFATEFQNSSDITLCHSIEQQNFGTTVPGKRLGWLGEAGLDCLQVINSVQENQVNEYFENKGGELHTSTPLHLFMVTTNNLIAESDCLFYLSPAVMS